jgi:hypothetical protein
VDFGNDEVESSSFTLNADSLNMHRAQTIVGSLKNFQFQEFRAVLRPLIWGALKVRRPFV